MTHDIFISFSTRDRAVADSLKQYLDGHGMSCWMSAAAIDGGEVWTRAIVDGITGARAMVLLLSVNSNASEHVRREIYLARERHLRIIPFRIDEVEPDGDLAYNLAGIQWLQGSGAPTDGEFERLAQSVRGYLSRSTVPPPPAAEAAVAAVDHSTPADGGQRAPVLGEGRNASPERPQQTTPASARAPAEVESELHSPAPPRPEPAVVTAAVKPVASGARVVEERAEPTPSDSPRDLNPLIGFIAIVVLFGGLLLAGKIITSL